MRPGGASGAPLLIPHGVSQIEVSERYGPRPGEATRPYRQPARFRMNQSASDTAVDDAFTTGDGCLTLDADRHLGNLQPSFALV